METAVLDNKTGLNDDDVANRILTFHDAVEMSASLEIIGTDENREIFILRDLSKAEGVEGAFVEVTISEIVDKVTEFSKAQEFIKVIENKRTPIVLQGVTRIVGYYSRVNNWNKSKVGELRDRAKGDYGLTGKNALFHKDRMKAINAL